MSIYGELLKPIDVPKFFQVFYDLTSPEVENVSDTLRKSLAEARVIDRIRPGNSVAITAGSREIDHIVPILKTLVDGVKTAGGRPFIVPAMGSHGGADAELQTALLAELGITEASVGAEIVSSIETVAVGYTEDGLEVRIDKNAADADGIIVVGRVKPHTSFRGQVESGLMKMLAIGLGKPYGAMLCHQLGFENMGQNVWNFGNVILKNSKVLFGVAIVDNNRHKIASIEAIPAEKIPLREPDLLIEAKNLMPSIPFNSIDLLIVEEMGKEYSGTGMDMNVTGRCSQLGNFGPAPKRICALDLTCHSRGNASGIGEADIITERFEQKIDRRSVYVNAITVRDIGGMKIPAVMPNDCLAIKLGIHTILPKIDTGKLRIVIIKNTLQLDHMYLSEGLLEEAYVCKKIKVLEEPHELVFDSSGNINFKAGRGETR